MTIAGERFNRTGKDSGASRNLGATHLVSMKVITFAERGRRAVSIDPCTHDGCGSIHEHLVPHRLVSSSRGWGSVPGSAGKK
jgi:hypothetical protein